jgi:putative membrane protein
MHVRESDWSEPRRQSPVALLFLFGRVLKEFWPLLLFLAGRQLFGSEEEAGKRDPDRVLYVILGLAATFLLLGLYYVVEYLRFRYSIGAGELTFTSGVFVVKKTSIPLENIQSVHLKQGYINRLTDTYGLKVETAGTDGEELEIKAIDREQALALQDVLQSRKQHTERRDEPESDVLIVIRPMELLKLAVSENHVKTFLVILAFAFSRLDDLMQVFGDRAGKAIDERMEQVELAGRGLAMLTGVVLAVTLAVSLVRVWLRYHGMQLRLSEEGFRMQWGFLQTQRKQLLKEKIQMLSWSSNLLRVLLGIRILRFYMAGETMVGGSEQWIRLPVVGEETLGRLTAAYCSQPPSEHALENRVHPSYGWRPTMMIALPLCASLSVILGFWKPWAVWMPLAALTYETVTNLVRRRKCRFWYDNDTLQVEGGVWGRRQSLLNFERVQHVAVKTSPYLRSKGLATLVLHTAGKSVTIPFIPEGQARYLADLSLVRVEFARDADRAGVSCP